MTEPAIETVVQHLNGDRHPKISIRDPNMPDGSYDLSDEIVKENISGIFSFDCIVIYKDDLEKIIELIGGPSELPIDLKIFARHPYSTRYWGTTYNAREYMDEDKYRELIEEGHGFTCERARPVNQMNNNLILYLDR